RRILFDVSASSSRVASDFYRRVGRIGRESSDLAACVRRPAGTRRDGADGAPASQSRCLRGKSVWREQRAAGGGLSLSLFLRAGGGTQSKAASQSRASFGVFPTRVRCLRADPTRRTNLQAKAAGDARRQRLAGRARPGSGGVVVEVAHHPRRL